MSMYPNTGAALINAFNSSLFDSYKSTGWQRLASELCDKYPELDKPMPDNRNFDRSRMTRNDWAAQAGMVSGLLRRTLAPVEYHLLRIRYTFDGEMISQRPGAYVRLKMTDNLQSALVEGWPEVRSKLIQDRKVRNSVLRNQNRLQYMCLRALRPDVMERALQAEGREQQATVNRQQCEVRGVVNGLIRQAYNRCEALLEENYLLSI